VVVAFDKTMPAYAQWQAASRLDRFAYELGRANKSTDPDAVHDLRVSIRRFASCLRLFRTYFPKKEVKRIRRRLKGILMLAGEVRDCDIAIELCQKAGIPADGEPTMEWAKRRGQAARKLAPALKRAVKADLSDKWRSRLNLG